MAPSYEAFMRPLLDCLPESGDRPLSEVADATADQLNLDAPSRDERVAWDGMRVVEARVRKAAQDLEMAGLIVRDDDRLALSSEGRRARSQLPSEVDVAVLTERFPAYAAYRQDFLQRRGA